MAAVRSAAAAGGGKVGAPCVPRDPPARAAPSADRAPPPPTTGTEKKAVSRAPRPVRRAGEAMRRHFAQHCGRAGGCDAVLSCFHLLPWQQRTQSSRRGKLLRRMKAWQHSWARTEPETGNRIQRSECDQNKLVSSVTNGQLKALLARNKESYPPSRAHRREASAWRRGG